ncbi:class I SAM-dependent rRNA methyltransferase [Bacillus sp. B1-b2]|uniref:class I SAM-dependent rRNA methyltransferase n=1 Tax=Bacillus sp. B1-b2 TaxID=2653201 RepID=UPI001261EE58|nr:class I SAM-dependent rRNA methyltransferase [Bacillus sp. B1-b2]KAB7673239.1 class I SAM-dependent rRNA methyltransferase [Bacillus sp. B1-b2]
MDIVKVQLETKYEKSLSNNSPLIEKEAIRNTKHLAEGQLIDVFTGQNHFIGRGYYAIQNKGIGWILTRDKNQPINFDFFQDQIKNAIHKRSSLLADEKTTAFRLFNGEGDGIGGFTVDLYNDFLLIQWYSIGIYQYKNWVIDALEKTGLAKGIYEKKRFDQKGTYMEGDDFVTGTQGDFPITILENGIKYAVDLNDGAMTGIFLDQRDVRKTIRDKYAKGKNVLNTFSYTGAFSVAAAMGQSASTTSVDLANRSLKKTKENFLLNNLDLEKQKIIVEDVFHYFKYAVKKKLAFDMVVLDPPSFARSKKHTFSASKDYTKLLKEVISITNRDGIIVASTNCSTFDMKRFKSFILAAFDHNKASYEIVEQFELPSDFASIKSLKESNYLKVLFIKKKI